MPEKTVPAEVETTNPGLPDDVWAALSRPFRQDEIELLPKQLRKDDKDRFPCEEGPSLRHASKDGHACGGYHAKSVHLHYAGHANITMRLNEAAGPDGWSWTPAFVDPTPLQAELLRGAVAAGNADLTRLLFEQVATSGVFRGGPDGMWISLTIRGVTKLGFADAAGKNGPNAWKELIGDGLRNAAMRFGVGTYLWAKSDTADALKTRNPEGDADQQPDLPSAADVTKALATALDAAQPIDALRGVWMTYTEPVLQQVLLEVDGQQVPAAQVLLDHKARIERALVAEQERAEQDQRAEGAPEQAAPQQQDAPSSADEIGARLVAQGEQANADARAHAEQHASRSRAEESPAARAATSAQQDMSPKKRALLPWINELVNLQAAALGVTAGVHAKDLMAGREGQAVEDLPLTVLRAWVQSRRPLVVQALRDQGSAPAANAYLAVPAAQPADADAVLLAGEDAGASQGARQDAPQNA